MATIIIIEDRLRVARSIQDRSMGIVRDAYDLSLPQREPFRDTKSLVVHPEIYDSTAVIGVQRFATKLQTMLVPTAQTWMRLKSGSNYDTLSEENTSEYAERQMQYDLDTKAFFEEIKMSNFDTQVAEAFQDLSISTGAITVSPAPLGSASSIIFKAIPISQLIVEEGTDGTVNTSWREHTVRLDTIDTYYPNAKLSGTHKADLKENPNATIMVVESVIYNVKENTYDVDVVDLATNHHFLSEVEDSNPRIVFRENVVSGTPLGFGRILSVLPDIRMVNKIKQLLIQGGSIAVSGTFTAHDDGVLNPYNVRLRAGGVIPVNSNDPRNPSIARLDTPTNFDWGTMEIQQLQATINDMLLANPYGTIEDTPVRTATEITARSRNLFESVSSSFGRMQIEFVIPIIRRVIRIMQQAGRIGDNVVLDGRETTFDFISPLTRLQESADIDNVLEYISVLGTFGEETLQLGVKMEKIPQWLGDKYNVPQELIRTEGEQVEVATASIELQNAGLEAPSPSSASVNTAGTL